MKVPDLRGVRLSLVVFWVLDSGVINLVVCDRGYHHHHKNPCQQVLSPVTNPGPVRPGVRHFRRPYFVTADRSSSTTYHHY